MGFNMGNDFFVLLYFIEYVTKTMMIIINRLGLPQSWGIPRVRWMVFVNGKIPSFKMDDDLGGTPMTQESPIFTFKSFVIRRSSRTSSIYHSWCPITKCSTCHTYCLHPHFCPKPFLKFYWSSVQNPSWLMISSGIILPNILGITIVQ